MNHLAPFVLNRLLHDRLAASAPARIVQLTAGLAAIGRINLAETPGGGDFHRLRTYANTKLWNLFCTRELAHRFVGTGVTANAVHPGVVRTRLGDASGGLGLVLRAVKLFWASPDKEPWDPSAWPWIPRLPTPTAPTSTGCILRLCPQCWSRAS